jgi:hypothetical protein
MLVEESLPASWWRAPSTLDFQALRLCCYSLARAQFTEPGGVFYKHMFYKHKCGCSGGLCLQRRGAGILGRFLKQDSAALVGVCIAPIGT